MNKQFLIAGIAAVAATALLAAPTTRSATRGGRNSKPAAADVLDDEAPTTGKEGKIEINTFPRLGKASCSLGVPSINGSSGIGRCYNKPRNWIVLETKYTTYSKWQEQLTFTWHVLLDTKTATENKGNRDGLPPYSYFTQSVTYQNIPKGGHAASVCLHPSYLERFGEPKAIGLVITNQKGEVLAGDCESEIEGIPHHPKSLDDAFWNNQKIMNANDKEGKPMIVQRQGLQDRSKTIWALVNAADYEDVVQ